MTVLPLAEPLAETLKRLRTGIEGDLTTPALGSRPKPRFSVREEGNRWTVGHLRGVFLTSLTFDWEARQVTIEERLSPKVWQTYLAMSLLWLGLMAKPLWLVATQTFPPIYPSWVVAAVVIIVFGFTLLVPASLGVVFLKLRQLPGTALPSVVKDALGLTTPADFAKAPESSRRSLRLLGDLPNTLAELRRRLAALDRPRSSVHRLLRNPGGWVIAAVDARGAVAFAVGRLVLADSPRGPVLELRPVPPLKLTTPRAAVLSAVFAIPLALLASHLWPGHRGTEVGTEVWFKAVVEGLCAGGAAAVAGIPLVELGLELLQMAFNWGTRGAQRKLLEAYFSICDELDPRPG